MDKLAKRLREDAEKIEARITPQLENRIEASLQGVSQEGGLPSSSRRTASFWWASSLTGVAATLAIVAIVNFAGPEPETGVTEPPLQQYTMPRFDWKPKTAVLTQTLEQELVDIQSDLKKAQQTVRDDIDEIM